MTETTIRMLRQYAAQYETPAFLDGDPSWFMHQVEGTANREAMAFLASCLSYGSRPQFMEKIMLLLQWSGGETDAWVRHGLYEEHFAVGDCRSFYRLYSHDTMCRFLDAYRHLLLSHGTLGDYVRQRASDGHAAIAAICHYFASLGISTVVPKDTQSACKRVCMFMRWMVRSGSPVDLGLWAAFIDRRTLVMPLDTHVLSQSVRMGLLSAKTASMSTARRLTATLATVFPDDPLKGDFALFGYGVNESKNGETAVF